MTKITTGTKMVSSGLNQNSNMLGKVKMPNGFVSPPMEQKDSLSPCVNVCELDENFDCKGCDRTTDEILKWPEYTDEQKHAVLDRLFGSKG